jgi:hypothetical protein
MSNLKLKLPELTSLQSFVAVAPISVSAQGQEAFYKVNT